jgi:ABC-2 type transport system ATP-binding protein
LELVDLHKRYGDIAALDGLTMTVAAGRMHGFVGRNGAGKTTAMRVALGLVTPDTGEVRWQGAAPTPEDRRRFGYMPEERGLYPKMRLADQVAYFGELSGMAHGDARREAERWLADLGLGDRMTDNAETLSQGNQQRVQLAAALVQGPDLLVLDEPFNGLDPVGVDVLSGVLKDQVAAGAAVVFSSHQLELVERLCDSVAIVNGGRLVAAGDVDELRGRHAGRRFRIEVDAPDDSWVEAAPGAARVNGSLVELDDDADPQALLDAARAAGPVRRFGPEQPSLAEIFREAVAAPADPQEPGS